jgi:hypothetical protein
MKKIILKNKEKIEELNKKIIYLENKINLITKDKLEKIALFEESTIIKTDYEKN